MRLNGFDDCIRTYPGGRCCHQPVLFVPAVADQLFAQAFLGREAGLSISTENDPERAFERVVDGEFDAVVSDLAMPRLDGLTLCRRLREAGSDVPFLLFTGRAEAEVPDVAGKECVTAFVRKGGTMDQYEELAAHIRDALD